MGQYAITIQYPRCNRELLTIFRLSLLQFAEFAALPPSGRFAVGSVLRKTVCTEPLQVTDNVEINKCRKLYVHVHKYHFTVNC